MVCSKEESPIYNIKISSVGPGQVTGQDAIHEPSNMDLAMKLHYLRGVYYFKSQAFQGLTIMNIKETMFNWLNHCYVTCGRLRRSDSGRPYIKCNDCGVRLVEGQCHKTLDEWLDANCASLDKLLVPNQVIGPELPFSPLVFIQLTKFKCGGTSVGLSWAHILGDAFFAAEFMNMWSKAIAGHQPAQPLNVAQLNVDDNVNDDFLSHDDDPISLKRVGPVGDNWIAANTHKMGTFSFQVSSKQLNNLRSKICEGEINHKIPPFESLCAAIWQSVAKVKDGPEPNIVTICKSDPKNLKKGSSRNTSQVISVVKANFPIVEASPKELGLLMVNEATNEQKTIEDAVKRDHGLPDFKIYGANLTFVNLEDVPFYGLEVKGQKPVLVSYTIDGIGDEGVVLVLPMPPGEDGTGGRMVTITMPENQVLELKSVLKKEWSIIA